MNEIHADLQRNTRVDIEIELITKQAIECDGERIYRLIVADSTGEQFAILRAPENNVLQDLETGEIYQITDLLGTRAIDTEYDDAENCPDCGGQLRPGHGVDAVEPAIATAAEQFEFNEPFGIIDNLSSIQRVRNNAGTIDDWTTMETETDHSTEIPHLVCIECGRHVDEFEPHDSHMVEQRTSTVGSNAMLEQSQTVTKSSVASPAVGLAAGGSKDVTNFRENIQNGYTPQPEAITDEGLFYDYYFKTSERTTPDSLFAPRYAAAISNHPLTDNTEQYLSVGLDSTMSVAEFERPQLDLVAVLDVSGSMDSQFDEYYYDEQGQERESQTSTEMKIEAATKSLCALTKHLHAEDRLGVVLYNHRAHVAKPLRDVGNTDMPAIRRHIREVVAGGSTNLEDGFEAAVDMLIDGTSSRQVERRIVFMTDMMPNTGATGENELTTLFADAAAEGIHTTFIGMGLDANAELTDSLSRIRGANHYFVNSGDEFEQRLSDEFEYMVTPLVYDLELELDTDGYEIEAVHGSSSSDVSGERLMHVETLFPSAKQDGEVRGGVVLIRLSQTSQAADLSLIASWEERDGSEQTERVSVAMPETSDSEIFAHNGVRKAVALARYARELRMWARDIHNSTNMPADIDDWLLPDRRGEQEREAVTLVVPDQYSERFACLRGYLNEEIAAVGDESLQRELNLLDTLCQQNEKAKANADPQE